MIHYIHRAPKFEQALTSLREKGGVSLSAARKADEIIQRILLKGRENSLKVGRLTQKGELRIRHGIKYDLGNGYRLVCAKKGPLLFLLYIGTHDQCSRWLERHKEFQLTTDENDGSRSVTRELPPNPDRTVNNDLSDDYEDQLIKKIDDKMLRKIFCGIIDKNF